MLTDDYDFNIWVGKLVVLTLDKGKTITAHVLYADKKHRELILEILSDDNFYPERTQRAYIVPFGRVLTVGSAADNIHANRKLPEPDPCRDDTFTWDRLPLFIPLILIAIPGSFIFYICFGLRISTAVIYTAAIIHLTFSAYKGQQRYLFECPIVQAKLGQLALRHSCFLATLVMIETLALSAKSHLSSYWFSDSGLGMPPFRLSLFVIGMVLGLIEAWTNRSLLERAHLLF